MVAHDDKFRVLRKLPEVRFEEELRGYSKSQVDRVLQSLAPLADDVAWLQGRLAEAESRAASAEARLLETSTRAAAPAPAPVAAPAPAPATPPADFDETLSKTLLLAQRTADQTVAQARAEADALLSSARAEADGVRAETDRARQHAFGDVAAERQRLLAEAHAEVQAKVAAAEASLVNAEGAERARLADEIADLSERRRVLATDIENLEGHLAQRRETIKDALAAISAVVDDPGRLHSEMPPIVGDSVGVPAAAGPLVLDVAGLDDLAPVMAAPAPSVIDDAAFAGADDGDPTQAVDAVTLLEAPFEPESPSDPFAAMRASEPAAASPFEMPVDTAPIESTFVAPTFVGGDPTDDFANDWSMQPDTWSDSPEPTDVSPRERETDSLRWSDVADDDGTSEWVATEPSALRDAARPTWAETVPDAREFTPPASEDPFLDELRRATGDNAETDAALERFLADNPDDDRRSGWFSRRK